MAEEVADDLAVLDCDDAVRFRQDRLDQRRCRCDGGVFLRQSRLSLTLSPVPIREEACCLADMFARKR
jgi:hypothetical protein